MTVTTLMIRLAFTFRGEGLSRLLFVGAGMLCFVACVSIKPGILSRDQFVPFAASVNGGRDDWFYCGTDETHHHFLTRVADVSVARRVPKEEIKLAETWAVGAQVRKVYPQRGFVLGDERKAWVY